MQGTNTYYQFGDYSPTSATVYKPRINTTSVFSQISVGDRVACGILSTTLRLYCWGSDQANVGSLGLDPATFSVVYPRAVNSTGTWTAVAAGGPTTCGIQSDLSLWCWVGRCMHGAAFMASAAYVRLRFPAVGK